MVDVLESLTATGIEALRAGMHFYTREYGWCEVESIDIPLFDQEMYVPILPTTVTLTEPKGDAGVTELRFAPGAQVLAALPVEMPPTDGDEPPAEEPVEEPAAPGHYVYRDSGTGEFVEEDYALANPDTTTREWVADDPSEPLNTP